MSGKNWWPWARRIDRPRGAPCRAVVGRADNVDEGLTHRPGPAELYEAGAGHDASGSDVVVDQVDAVKLAVWSAVTRGSSGTRWNTKSDRAEERSVAAVAADSDGK